MWRPLLIAASFLALFIAHSRAGDRVPADPWQVIHIARSFGPAEVTRDSLRDPRIDAELDGIAYQVDFYGCWMGRDCKTILLQARLSKEGWEPAAEEIADWNAGKLIGRAWISGESVAVLDYPVVIGKGLPKDVLEASFDAWRGAIEEFSEDVDFK